MVVFCAAAYALGEGGLGGIRLDSPPSALLRSPAYGNPGGIVTSGGVFNSFKTLGLEDVGPGGLPHWAYAVHMEGMAPSQVLWGYNRGYAAIGFLISGEGADARITAVVASLWNSPRPPQIVGSNIVQTKKGIQLGDAFMRVVLKYGFPRTLTVLTAPVTQPAAALGPGALPAALGRPGVAGAGTFAGAAGGISGLGFRLGGRESSARRSGGSAAGAGYSAFAAAGAGRLPPASPLVPRYQEGSGQFSGVLMGQQIAMSRHMLVGYPEEGLEFALYDMKVVRIYVYPVAVGAPPAGAGAGAAAVSATSIRAATTYAPGPTAPTGGGVSLRLGGRR
jgi:hypothetical protein